MNISNAFFETNTCKIYSTLYCPRNRVMESEILVSYCVSANNIIPISLYRIDEGTCMTSFSGCLSLLVKDYNTFISARFSMCSLQFSSN